MTTNELNKYIKHYLEKDMTNMAIMLTGKWGSGKTYYIEHELRNFLNDDGKNQCIVVSLYGINEISDISKSIYMETRTKTLIKNSETRENVKIFTKTIVKGIIGTLGIDVNVSEEDLQNIYSSVDLSGKLLILEDIERSNIDIVQLLGYVNNLVERDGVKILLVANEDELLQKLTQKTLSKKAGEKDNVSRKVENYLRIKEKTIGDTIYFNSDYYKAVKNIMENFGNKKLNEIMKQDAVEKVAVMVMDDCDKNLRTFIFATQKTVDLFDKIRENIDKNFLINIYFSIIHFSSMIKGGSFPKWEGTDALSTALGTNQYPLFKFCYDYIRWQKIDNVQITETEKEYNNFKLYNDKADREDKDLQVLYTYYERTEVEVIEALKSIEIRLQVAEDIGFYSYGKLVAHFVMLSHIIGFDYTNCKKYMIKNIRGRGNEIDSDFLFLPIYELEKNEKTEYDDFVRQLCESMNLTTAKYDLFFSYNPNDLNNLYNYVVQEKHKINYNHEFISKCDVNKLVEMILSASSKQIHDFRGILFAVYRYASKGDFAESDIETMKKILRLVQEKIKSENYSIDKIQRMQIDLLCDNLETFISQMS